MLKITKINDAGWFGQQNLDVNSASEVTLSNIVDKIKKAVRVGADGKVVKIMNGRVDNDRKSVIKFQVLVQNRNGLNWMEMPLEVTLPFETVMNLRKNNDINYRKELSAIHQKLKTFTNKTIYEDKTIRTDSIKDEYDDADLQFLIDDEIEAINGYKKVIEKTDNPKLLALLSHILKEEAEHVEELRNAQAGKFEIDD